MPTPEPFGKRPPRASLNSFPLNMGPKNTPLDWSQLERRCMARFGFLPTGRPLTQAELNALGFSYAGAMSRLGDNYNLLR